MDARHFYQLTIILRRSYYVSSSHVSRVKHVEGGGNVIFPGEDNMGLPREVPKGNK